MTRAACTGVIASATMIMTIETHISCPSLPKSSRTCSRRCRGHWSPWRQAIVPSGKGMNDGLRPRTAFFCGEPRRRCRSRTLAGWDGFRLRTPPGARIPSWLDWPTGQQGKRPHAKREAFPNKSNSRTKPSDGPRGRRVSSLYDRISSRRGRRAPPRDPCASPRRSGR